MALAIDCCLSEKETMIEHFTAVNSLLLLSSVDSTNTRLRSNEESSRQMCQENDATNSQFRWWGRHKVSCSPSIVQ